MSTAGYDKLDYLIDRENIHDVVSKMMFFVDTKQWDRFQMEIFDVQFHHDYCKILGGEPQQLNAAQLVEQWKPLIESMAATQHFVSQVIINLPHSDTRSQEPETCTVFANVIAHFTKIDRQGYHKRMTSHGARYYIEMVRTKKLGNPWRISLFRADPIWEDGDTQVLYGPTPPRSYGRGW